MKRNQFRLIAGIIMLMVFTGLSGCGKKKDNQAANTLGEKYSQSFQKSATKDADKMADELVALGIFEADLSTMEVWEGFLNGFDNEIKGFTKGTMFSPMIGAIPFVGYVFETDNPDELMQTLKASANLNWNVCTMADEMVCEARDDLVLFMMVSNEE